MSAECLKCGSDLPYMVECQYCKQQRTITTLVEALQVLDDYFELGRVAFDVSDRFYHAAKVIKDTLHLAGVEPSGGEG